MRQSTLRQRPPLGLYAYLAGISVSVLIGMLPSDVQTTYSVNAIVLYGGLLVGLALGSEFCRLALVVLGIFWGVAVLGLISPAVDFVAIGWSAVALGSSLILTTPSMRRYTQGTPL